MCLFACVQCVVMCVVFLFGLCGLESTKKGKRRVWRGGGSGGGV